MSDRCPAAFKVVIEKCWNHDPSVRPSFKWIKKKLSVIAGEIGLNVVSDDINRMRIYNRKSSFHKKNKIVGRYDRSSSTINKNA